MKKVIIMFALAMGIITANAQENVTVETTNGSEQPTLTKEVYPQKEADGDLYHGLSRKLTFDRMIPPHGLEVTYDKTVHVIFPAEVRYVDLGSPDLIAGKADGAENIIRVKATVRNFPNETNMSVITEDGSFYTFNVKYAAEPLLLNVEMCDFIHDGSTVNRPNNAQEIYLKELGSESPMLVRLIMKSIHKQNKREVKHIGCKRFGIQYLLKGIYTHNGLLYFHTEIKNQSNVPFDVDYITWKIVDKKVAKRTAVQEQIILPLRAQNYATLVPGKKSERTVFTMAKFTIPDDKCLVFEGFMDFLSAVTLGVTGNADCLVLNSVANVEKAAGLLDGYGRIGCFLDRDEAGRRTLAALTMRYGERVTDRSSLYDGCKDLNEYLQLTTKKQKNNHLKIEEQ